MSYPKGADAIEKGLRVMMFRKTRVWVLWYEGLGFALLLGVIWLDYLAGLSSLLLGGDPSRRDWREPAFESVCVLVVGTTVWLLTYRLLKHVLYLEGFLRVCAWCRRVAREDNWMKMEDYFAKGLRVETTHAVCPECLDKMKAQAKDQPQT
jgi:hypothetical protein